MKSWRIYELATGVIMWGEDIEDESLQARKDELEAQGYGLTDLIVMEPWAKPVIVEETGEIINDATPEEQAAYESEIL